MKNCEQAEEKLTSYALGELSPADTDTVRLHLTECEGCRAALAEIEPTLDLIRDALAARSGAQRLTDERRAEVLRIARAGRFEGFSFQRVAAMAAILLIGVCVGAMGMFFMLKKSGVFAGVGAKGESALVADMQGAGARGETSSIVTVAGHPRPSPMRGMSEPGESAGDNAGATAGGTAARAEMRTSSGAGEVKAKDESRSETAAAPVPKPGPPAASRPPDVSGPNLARLVKPEAPETAAVAVRPGADTDGRVREAALTTPAAPASRPPAGKGGDKAVASIPARKPKPAQAAARTKPAGPARVRVEIARGRYGGDWNVNPLAMDRLVGLAGSDAGAAINADFQARTIDIASPDLTNSMPLFVFLSGTRNFTFSNKELERMREYLLGGGCVWADAGRPGRNTVFDLAFRREIKRAAPGIKFAPAPAGHALYDRIHKGVGLAPGAGGARTPAEIGWLNGRPAALITVNGYGALLDGNAESGGSLAPGIAGPDAAATNAAGLLALGAGRFGVNAIVYIMLGNPDALCAVPDEYRPAAPAPGAPPGQATNIPAAGAHD